VACSGGDSTQADWARAASPAKAAAQIEYEDRLSAEHCQTLTPAGYHSVERIAVPTDGASVVTQTTLELGRAYKLRAWGTCQSGGTGDGLSDPEFSDFSSPTKSVFDTCNNVDTGIAINAVGATPKQTRWGTECESHAYTLDVVGQGAPLNLNYHDCALGDNHGTLNVDVFASSSNCPDVSTETPIAVINGGFETPIAGANLNSYQTLTVGSTVLPGWSVDNGEVDLEQGGFWVDAEGTQSIDLNGVKAGAIAQTLSTVAGQTYDVSFALAGNTDCAPAIKVVEVDAADQSASFQFDVTGHSKTAMGWQLQHFAFRASDTQTQLVFRSLIDGSCGPALDDVRVAQIVCLQVDSKN
jgi:choice-of-anchor C domain-containing protein